MNRRTVGFVASLRRGAAGLALLAVLLSGSALYAQNGSWTQFQGDAMHSGHVAVTIHPAAIQPAWAVTSVQLGQMSLRPGAVTDGEHVYLTTRLSTDTYQVLALDRPTGVEHWRRSFVPNGSDGLSSPSVGNGKVYVHQWGHSSGPVAGYPYLMGMNAQTGQMQFATSHDGQWSSGSRPTVAGTQVFAAGGYYGGLDGYSGVTGAKVWSAAVNQQYGWIPAADAQRVYVYMGPASASPGPQIGTLYAFNRTTGGLAFAIQNPPDATSLYKGTVFLGGQDDALTLTSNRTIVSFNLLSRTVRWRVSGNYNGNMAIDDGLVFAANGIQLDVLDEATGDRLNSWFVPPGRALNGNLLVTDNLVFAQTDRATYALDRASLQPVWSTDIVGDLALGDGMLLISNSTSITAFVVPEPTALALLAAGAVVVLSRRRRR